MTCDHFLGNGLFARQVDRRVILKASAAFSAMAALSSRATRGGRAQESSETVAATWVESENSADVQAASVGSDSRVVQSNFPFYAIGPHWSGDIGAGAAVELSFSADGSNWLDPLMIGEAVEDAGPPDRAGRRFGSLVFADGANFMRYRTLNASGEPAPLPGLAFTYIDATGGPTVDDVYAAALDPSIDPPPIITRSMWGANDRYRHEAQDLDEPIIWPPDYQEVEHIIIHHTATPNFQAPLTAIRSIYYYHAVTRGWGDIGYNYLVDYMGNVYEGRYGGENVIGGHAYQYAYGSSGIGTMGSFNNETETPEAQAGLIWITAWTGRFLDPYGSSEFHESTDLPTICAHRDVDDTTCPGDILYSDLDWIRSSVQAVLDQEIDPALDPDFVPGDTVRITFDEANLRSGPGTNFSILEMMAIGTILTITDGPATNDGFTWYRVSGDVGRGWAATVVFELESSAPPGSTSFQIGDVVAVDTDALNLRSGAGTSYAVIATMSTGAEGEVIDGPRSANGYAWYRLETELGTGWAAGEFLTLVAGGPSVSGEFGVGDTVQVDTDVLNLRSGPGAYRSVIASMPQGTTLTVTETPVSADGYVWYGVESDNYGVGWCAGDFLASAGGAPPAGSEFGVGDTVVVDTDVLNLRSGPGISRSVVASLPSGTELDVIESPVSADGYAWYGVTNDSDGSGWCAGDFLTLSSSGGGGIFGVGETVAVFDGALNLRAGPGISEDVIGELPDGAQVSVTDGPSSADGYLWYDVESDDYGAGWCAGEFLRRA